jgi:quinol-cytochrome oxidoreductase complex cytochrome b subunit/mono/diheme cytochrome c family protein
MKGFLAWLDHRTGCRALVHDALFEHIPGGARWRYVWGSTLVFAFVVQIVTGVILWSAYSPSAQTAWESVYYIQHDMTAGWLLRGVHHFMAHAMVVLLAIHFVQVVVDGAYRAPREINFWIGLVMMQLVLGLALTGYLLPWDEKGYWATKVATNMVALVPLVGSSLQRLLVGGSEYGHHTLTRFFALHAGVLPGLLIACTVIHVALFRRHGLKAREPYTKPDTTFWPDQVLRDAVACLAVIVVVLVLVFRHWSIAPPDMPRGDIFGTELGAPADPAENYSAARPENYFLFLFQLLKYLEVFPPVVSAIVVPGLIMFSLFLMPIVGRWELGHRFNVTWTFALLIGAGLLTAIAMRADLNGETEHSQHFLAAVADAQAKAERAVELAGSPSGIPPTGALSMLRADAKTQGPRLFREHCASCHSHFVVNDAIVDPSQEIVVDHPTASNLWGIGTRGWVRGILDPHQIAGPHYFGNTKLKDGDMVTWVEDTFGPDATADLDDDGRAKMQEKVDDVTFALAAEAVQNVGPIADLDERVAAGRALIVEEFACVDCHKFHDDGALGLAPDLTGYASAGWLKALISNPEHERFYPDTNDRMPAFAENDDPAANRLSSEELDLLVAWLRGEWYEPTH